MIILFVIGMIAPKFDKIKVLETRDDIIMMDIDISFPSEASVKVSFLNSITVFMIISDFLSIYMLAFCPMYSK